MLHSRPSPPSHWPLARRLRQHSGGIQIFDAKSLLCPHHIVTATTLRATPTAPGPCGFTHSPHSGQAREGQAEEFPQPAPPPGRGGLAELLSTHSALTRSPLLRTAKPTGSHWIAVTEPVTWTVPAGPSATSIATGEGGAETTLGCWMTGSPPTRRWYCTQVDPGDGQ